MMSEDCWLNAKSMFNAVLNNCTPQRLDWIEKLTVWDQIMYDDAQCLDYIFTGQ